MNTTKTQPAARMTPTEHEKSEWSRLASAAYRDGRNGTGHTFSLASALCGKGESMTLHRFDELQSVYRRWLIDGFNCNDV